MKKLFGLMLAMSALVLLAGCAKGNEEDVNRRIYAKSYIEEIDGTELEKTDVVIFNDDKTGTVVFQDIIPMIYDNSAIMHEDGTKMYDYTIDGYVLSLRADDFTEEFTLADESILEKIPDFEK